MFAGPSPPPAPHDRKKFSLLPQPPIPNFNSLQPGFTQPEYRSQTVLPEYGFATISIPSIKQ